MTRTAKITDEALVGRVLEAIRQGCTMESACSAGPVAKSTVYGWIRRGRLDGAEPVFVAFAEAVADAELHAERTLVELWRAQCPTDWRAAAELLARRFPDRWSPRAYRHHEYVEVGGYKSSPLTEPTEDEVAGAVARELERWMAEEGMA
jgi:hypothetical protein